MAHPDVFRKATRNWKQNHAEEVKAYAKRYMRDYMARRRKAAREAKEAKQAKKAKKDDDLPD